MPTSPKSWIAAARPRTLPLAAGAIILGSFVPIVYESFSLPVFVLTLLTAFGLQILSNFANDYGDFKKGTDNEQRIGPQRAMQSGAINEKQMKRALLFLVLFCLVSGISLLITAFGTANLLPVLAMLGLGLVSIWAAITYTVGKNAYGYSGLGDVSVILFFGLAGVMGTSFLYLHYLEPLLLLPALSYGLLSAGVLNINNMRDAVPDKAAGKITLAVKLGPERALRYHLALIITATKAMIVFVAFTAKSPATYFSLLALVPVLINTVLVARAVKNKTPLNPLLKWLAISSLVNAVFFVILLHLL